jgi:GH15 family glucan-1,4-alpha-glucosidase
MRYLIASDYGVIGNQYSSALVSNLGSIDWCCFPYLDSPSHFGALIDKNQGGRFQIMPQGEFRSEQRYLPKTMVIETLFETPTGRATLTDWMPTDEEKSFLGPALCRRIEVVEGSIPWMLTCTPRFRYGTDPGQAERHPQGIRFRGTYAEDLAVLQSSIPLEISANGASAVGRFTLNAGEKLQFFWVWGRRCTLSDINSNKPISIPYPHATIEHWRKLAHQCSSTHCIFGGPWHDLVSRSGLILKLLSTSYAGSIAEAAVISLKGPLPGSHTWGHRHTSIREGALLIQAFAQLGYIDEAHAYFAWLKGILDRDSAEGLQPFYTLDGGKVVPEREIPYISGHARSRQFQLDIYGHVLLTITEYYKVFHILPDDLWPKLSEIVDYVCQAWRRPDFGPWGLTQKPEHFVVSKLFCWAALDRACWLAKATGRNPAPRWLGEKNILHRTICEQGFDSNRNTFVRSFGDREIDSSVLWIPFLNFLPPDDPRIQGTLDAVQSQLASGVLLKRYRNLYELHSEELMDFWSSFFFIGCLALLGRTEEAGDRLAEVCTYANPLGLFGDQIETIQTGLPKSFPAASVHLALINAALYIGAARGIQPVALKLMGQEEEVAETHKGRMLLRRRG